MYANYAKQILALARSFLWATLYTWLQTRMLTSCSTWPCHRVAPYCQTPYQQRPTRNIERLRVRFPPPLSLSLFVCVCVCARASLCVSLLVSVCYDVAFSHRFQTKTANALTTQILNCKIYISFSFSKTPLDFEKRSRLSQPT